MLQSVYNYPHRLGSDPPVEPIFDNHYNFYCRSFGLVLSLVYPEQMAL